MLNQIFRGWLLERATEIIALSVWTYVAATLGYGKGQFYNALYIPLAVAMLEVTTLFFVSTFLAWVLIKSAVIRPFFITALAIAHAFLAASLSGQGIIWVLFSGAIVVILLNAVCHASFSSRMKSGA